MKTVRILHINSRLVFGVSVLLILIFIKLFTNVTDNMILAIAIIAVFLMIFSYVFKTESPNFLKVFITLFSFICLPLFLLFYLDVFNSFSNPLAAIALAVMITLIGITAVITLIKLNYVEILYDRIDEK